MLVRDLGEFALIQRIASRLPTRRSAAPAVVFGIGDDAALWRPTPGCVSVLTTDSMVEGVHFTHQTTPWLDLGWKALAANISDLAAMAALPRVALVTLGLTGGEDVSDIDALYDGMADVALRYGVQIIGGDTVRSAQRQVGITVIGEAPEVAGVPQVLRRSGAQPGDLLAISGYPGSSAGGLELLLRADPDPDPLLLNAHRRPQPRVAEALWLLGQGVRCATDSSDSLLCETDLLCAASGVEAWIDAARLPVASALQQAFPDRWAELALFGGEDYELVLAIDSQRFPDIQAGWALQFGVPLTAIGAFRSAGLSGPRVELVNYQGPITEFAHFLRSS